MQDRTNSVKVDAGARIRTLMGLPPQEEQRLSWTELHDAMTSMRAHGQRLPDALTEDDLDLIDSLVRGPSVAPCLCVPPPPSRCRLFLCVCMWRDAPDARVHPLYVIS